MAGDDRHILQIPRLAVADGETEELADDAAMKLRRQHPVPGEEIFRFRRGHAFAEAIKHSRAQRLGNINPRIFQQIGKIIRLRSPHRALEIEDPRIAAVQPHQVLKMKIAVDETLWTGRQRRLDALPDRQVRLCQAIRHDVFFDCGHVPIDHPPARGVNMGGVIIGEFDGGHAERKTLPQNVDGRAIEDFRRFAAV